MRLHVKVKFSAPCTKNSFIIEMNITYMMSGHITCVRIENRTYKHLITKCYISVYVNMQRAAEMFSTRTRSV